MSTFKRGKQIHSVHGGQLRTEQNNNRMLVSKNNVDQLIFGVNDDGNVAIKTSTDGIDVKSASDADLTFDSTKSFTVLKNDVYTIPATLVPASGSADGPTGAILHTFDGFPNFNAYFFDPHALDAFYNSTKNPIVNGVPINQGLSLTYQLYVNVGHDFLYINCLFNNSTGSDVTSQPIDVSYLIYTAPVQ